eukprot:445952_1
MTTILRTEFEKHHHLGDCWIEIEGKVYDVSEWMRKHPGGERLLECLGGKDASLPFLVNHHPSIRQRYLPTWYIGDLEPSKTKSKYDQLTKEFKILYHELWDKGWFETSYWYYTSKFTVLFSMMCGVFTLFHLCNLYSFWPLGVLASILLGMFWQQLAFIGHDIGHNALTHNVFIDSCIGLIGGNFLEGISIGWWKYTHNVHHVRTNDGEWDPDIQHMPVIAISKQYLADIWSQFHRMKMPPTSKLSWALSKLAIKYQHYHWFFTILASRAFVQISSLIFVFWLQPRAKNGRNTPFKGYRRAECVLLLAHFVYVASIFYFLTDHPILYYLVSYLTSGILHIQIIINHFPCPIFDDIDENNFVVHQLRSSMAIKSTKYTHWFYGGLQFQVEHHLFPMMPRPNLRKVKPYILALCKKYDLPYLENSFWGAIHDIGNILKGVAKHVDKLNEIHFDMQKIN